MIKETVTQSWLIRIGGFVMSIAIAISSFFLNESWNKISKIENAVHQLEISSATMKASIVTNSEFNTQRVIIDADRLALERRIIKVEESIPQIKDSLLRIEKAVDRVNGQASR